MFSNIDEGVRWLSPLANEAALHVGLSQETLAWPSPVEGTSGSKKPAALTCPRRKRAPGGRQRAAPAAPQPVAPGEVSEGSTDGAAARLTRPQRSSLPSRAHPRWAAVERPRSRQRAVKRAAVGGRMTARWSGVFLGAAETPVPGGSGSERRRVFPRRSAGSLRR